MLILVSTLNVLVDFSFKFLFLYCMGICVPGYQHQVYGIYYASELLMLVKLLTGCYY